MQLAPFLTANKPNLSFQLPPPYAAEILLPVLGNTLLDVSGVVQVLRDMQGSCTNGGAADLPFPVCCCCTVGMGEHPSETILAFSQ